MSTHRLLAALLARIRPARGRHAEIPGPPDEDTLVFPKVPEVSPDPDDVPSHWLTRFDLPPGRVRRYVHDEDKPGDDSQQ